MGPQARGRAPPPPRRRATAACAGAARAALDTAMDLHLVWHLLIDYLSIGNIGRLSRALCTRPAKWHDEVIAVVQRRVNIKRRGIMLQFLKTIASRPYCRECGRPCRAIGMAHHFCLECVYKHELPPWFEMIDRTQIKALYSRTKGWKRLLKLPPARRGCKGEFLYFHADVRTAATALS